MRSHATHSRQSCKKIMLLLFPLLRSPAMTQIVSPVLRAKPAVFLSTAADRTIRSVATGTQWSQPMTSCMVYELMLGHPTESDHISCYGNSMEPTNDIVYGL